LLGTTALDRLVDAASEVVDCQPARIEGGRGTTSAHPDRHQTLCTVPVADLTSNKESVLSTLNQPVIELVDDRARHWKGHRAVT
jgi:hypothetical protein